MELSGVKNSQFIPSYFTNLLYFVPIHVFSFLSKAIDKAKLSLIPELFEL